MDELQARKLLALKRGFTPEDLHAAYRSRIKGCHPDLRGDEDEAKEVIEAYGLLAGQFSPAQMIQAQTKPAQESAAGAYVPHGPDNPSIIEKARKASRTRKKRASRWDWVAPTGPRFPRV